MQVWRPDKRNRDDGQDPLGRRQHAGIDLGRRQRAGRRGRPRCRSTSGVEYQVEWPDGGDASKLDIVTVNSLPTDDLVGAAQVLIENGCQKQLDLLVEGASKVSNGN